MLLLKPIHNIKNTLRLLTSLLAGIVMLNKYARIGLLFVLFALVVNRGFAQQDCSIPYVVDLTASANVSYTDPGHVRSGDCDGDKNCISYKVLINPGTDVLAITSGQFAASDSYYIDGDGPYPVDQPACVAGNAKGYVIITFCKPGKNVIAITFGASAGIGVSPDITLRQGCTGTLSVTGMIQSTITWKSIAPGTQGAYNSYLNQTSGVSTVTVTPPAVPPAGGYVDYQVTGIEQSPCNTVTRNAVVRVWLYPKLTASISSSGASVCSGNPVTLTATPSGGNPAYTYSWNTGATTPSITVSTPGTYTVSVNDQLSTCGAATQSITIAATTPVPPTASPVSICIGSATVLTATAPGGPYQWYDPSGNPVGDGVSASYTTPAFMASGTYNYSVMTSFGGCPSQKTTVAVNVLPTSPAPTASPVTVCTGNQAILTATAPGAPYQWYDPSGNPVGNGSASYTAPLLPAGTYTYTVTSSVTGCSGQATQVTITVLPTPPGPTASSVTVCTGNPATLTATAPGGPYQWYDPSGNKVGDGVSASYTTPTFTTAGTYNYTVITSSGGCPSAPTTVTVTVLPTPPPPTAPPVTICSGSQANLSATAPGGPYQWYDPAGNPVGDGISAGYTTPVLTTGATNTIYSYTVKTSFGGCPSQPATVPVTVTPLPPTPTVQSQ